MKQLLRLLKILLFSRFRSSLDIFGEGVVSFRVWPNDLDPLLHMNNGVYLTLLDLGRIDFSIRTGLAAACRTQGIYPVVASEVIRFRRSLGPFSKFSIRTKCVHWDDKYFFISQQFEQRGQVAARAIIKGRFLKRNGDRVAPDEIFKLMGIQPVAPPQPEAVRHFVATDSLLG